MIKSTVALIYWNKNKQNISVCTRTNTNTSRISAYVITTNNIFVKIKNNYVKKLDKH